MPKRYRLRPTQRLLRNVDFISIRQKGKPYRCPFFAMYARLGEETRPNQLAGPRVGISASKRVGNAPDRNYAKRRFRELFRLNQHRINPDADLVISIRKPAVTASPEELEQRFLHALKFLGLRRSS